MLKEKKQELISLRDKVMEGVLLRSKARWIADGEKVTKYFCNLIVKDDGSAIYDSEEISGEVNNFYAQLYKPRKDIEQCEINDLINEIPQLSLEEKNALEGELTLMRRGMP